MKRRRPKKTRGNARKYATSIGALDLLARRADESLEVLVALLAVVLVDGHRLTSSQCQREIAAAVLANPTRRRQGAGLVRRVKRREAHCQACQSATEPSSTSEPWMGKR